MRICLACTELAPFSGAGGGMATAQMARALARASHEVHVLTLPAGPARTLNLTSEPDAFAPELAGIHIHFAEADPRLADQPPAVRDAWALHQRLLQLHAAHPFDVIELADFAAQPYFACQARRVEAAYPGALLALRLHTPNLLGRRFNLMTWINRADALVEHMDRAAIASADFLSAPSASVLKEVRDLVPSAAPGVVIANPYLDAPELIPPRDPATDDPLVLCFGRIEWRKGQDLLAQAACALLEEGLKFRVKFVGSGSWTGPPGERMDQYVQNLVPPQWSGRVEFRDWTSRQELALLIDEAALVVSPSRWDNFPYALIEAMARGCPVLAGDAGGPAEMIRPEVDGLLFRSGDAADLARVLRSALGDPGRTQSLGAAGRERILSICDPDRIAREFTDAVEAATAHRNPRPTTKSVESYTAAVFVPPNAPIEPTLASIRDQTSPPSAILVLDTAEQPSFTSSDADVVVLHLPNASAAEARNVALQHADTALVLLVDAGDVCAPNFAARALNCFATDASRACVGCQHLLLDTDSLEPSGSSVQLGAVRDMLWAVNPMGPASGIMLRRSAARQLGGFDGSLPAYEDWDFFARLAASSHAAAILPDFLLHRRVPADRRADGTVKVHHQRHVADLIARHPTLPEHPDWAARFVLAQVAERFGAAKRKPAR